MEYKDYYRVLQIDRNASETDVKRAYRKLARQYHPDTNPEDRSAEERFKEINEAYEVLGNPENRAKYDQLGRNYHRYQRMGGAPGGFDFSQWATAGGPGGYQRVNIDMDDLFSGGGGFSDFFDAIFGGGRRTRNRSADSIFGSQAQQATQNMEQQIEITLEEAFHGTTRSLAREGGEQFTAKIPRGARTGTKIRLRGKGNPGPAGPGDLYLVVKVLPHSTFRRDGDKLKTTIPVDVVTAVLGGKVSVPTLTGPVKLTIPPGTQGGRTFRLKGKGMPNLRDKNRYGDLLASVRIEIPKSPGDEELELYEKLAAISKK